MATIDDVVRAVAELPEVTEDERHGNRTWYVGLTGTQGRTGLEGQTGTQRQTGTQGQTGSKGGAGSKGRTGSKGRKAFAWERPFSKADLRRFGDQTPPDGPILAVRVEDLGEKAAVLAAQPDAFFTIPHFDGYAAVLIDLPKASPSALREALTDAWLSCAPPNLAADFLGRP